MAVGFGTPVVANAENSGSLTLSFSGVTSGQPIVLALMGITLAVSVSDTFSTHYTWTKISGLGTGTRFYIGTGGAGASGVVTVATTSGDYVAAAGVPCTGASTAAGAAAIGFSSSGGYNAFAGQPDPAVSSASAGRGAVWCLFAKSAITASPSSPFSSTAVTFSGVAEGSFVTYANVPTGTTCASWTVTTDGASKYSTGWLTINPATAPYAPTTVVAVPGNAQASVSFVAPNNGGSAITSYKVTASTGQTATGGSSPIVLTGLTNGVATTFTVVATNAVGTSTPSAVSGAVTPGTVPNAPFLFGAGGGNTTVTLSWDAPSTNGAPITGYNIYQGTTAGGESATPVNSSLIAATSYVVTGLTNLTEYFFKVEAVNVWGSSVASNEISGTPAVPLTFVAAPTLEAAAGIDALSGDPIVTLTVTNNQAAVTGVAATVFATILRSDGSYVIGASPTFPLALSPGAGTTATIADRTAAYGLPVSYVAFISYGGGLSAPSAAQHVVMGQAPDTQMLYERTGWAADQDESGLLLQWLAGIGQSLQRIDSLCRDGFDTNGNPAPGYSQLLDIDRCPTAALPWLAQFLGVRLNTNLRDDQQRYAIANPQGFGRGTPAAIVAAVNQYLSPGYTASLIERDTSPYHLSIKVPTAGIAGLSTCESVYLTYTTCSAVAAAFTTCAAMWKIPGEITAAVMNAIPAGLQASITYD